MDDAVAVALEIEAKTVLVLRVRAAPRRGAVLRVGREVTGLTLLQIVTAARHPPKLSPYGLRFNRIVKPGAICFHGNRAEAW